MACRRIDFNRAEWQPGGHPLELKKASPAVGLTMLEFAPGFEDPKVCLGGHAALILEGVLALILEDGSEVHVEAGNAFHLDPGTPHRARNPGDTPVRLFIHSFG